MVRKVAGVLVVVVEAVGVVGALLERVVCPCLCLGIVRVSSLVAPKALV